MTARPIGLNADLGEGAGSDDDLLALVTAASIACGGHAGDPASMRTAVRAAADRGVAVGAHPSYLDRDGFGRRDLAVPLVELRRQVLAQVRDLGRVADDAGVAVTHLKAHGALYNAAMVRADLALLLTEVAATALATPLPVYALPGSALATTADEAGLPVVREGFADRAVRPDGTLVPRSEPGAVLRDAAEVRGRMAILAPLVDTVCVHGDTPGALLIARAARDGLVDAGYGLVGAGPR
ncbi:UPF0271 protein [Salana multivorans]|uniref:UPF0271 protein n=1 Tax=Salana multivorans TaxID=120377 RepID=A0A3N2D7D0_9MICO|nr:5-oxoprolinase subunit PxpA [Salana multivorans]OJX98219.1 MAG: hypothetical protein BGO96_03190 [Micrococcales bacterium 73-15]ROR95602.1 UPF0271 protein [Salana multivorans]